MNILNITSKNIALFNENLRYDSPADILSFVLNLAERPVVTTSFGTYSAAVLHATTKVNKQIPIIWCDTGFNTDATYQHALTLIDKLSLSVDIFTPRLTTAFLKHTIGTPEISNPMHAEFSEKVKLEPFNRAFKKHNPDVWITNLRKDQNTFRSNLDILTLTSNGVLKVAPFFYYSNTEIVAYLKKHRLPIEFDYYDPVKALENRECGIHLKN
ncbi:phosphoadenosine phosphosulfate reductase domain-containing protein [Cochleicola gelatinilyticus]|uniref:Phosphoadenylylsulfate reductase n=1 Tax=Cochleicola gelatinilyticus TaxID=1763537 RepID=A0A167EZ72_9FLAO|nr:phosphoadenosine phosphosulfate reductase family protein [Cochleicola gelatinilyticus]OAB76029.1 phosphoadenylylsulfate reductase [Cochleicola gelatinilyticus]